MNNIRNSLIIDNARFPLAIMVVFIHYTGVGEMVISSSGISHLTGSDIYSFIRIIISKVIAQVAVPAFFLISGYLFFQGLNEWKWQTWCRKVKRRIHSLLIPYLLWVTLYVLYIKVLHTISGGGRLYDNLFSNWHFIGYYYNCIYADTGNINWIGTANPTCCPIFIPFWFIRDLMFMVCLSPLLFLAIRKIGRLFILLMLLAYVSQIWLVVPGISIRAICFFSLGGYLAMNTCNIPYPIIKASYFSTIILALLCCVRYHTCLYWNLLPWFVLSAGLTLWDIGKFIVKKQLQMPKVLVQATFFIFAFHFFLLKLLDLFPAWNVSSPSGLVLLYFLVPFVIVCISVGLYYILNKWCHRVTKILVGR